MSFPPLLIHTFPQLHADKQRMSGINQWIFLVEKRIKKNLTLA